MENNIQKDAKLIDDLGGSASVAKMLGFSQDIGVQRVNNWKSRGIPAKIKIKRPDLFLRQALQEQEAA